MSFTDELRKESNKTVTTNGDKAYKSTLNSNLDVFAFAGAARNNNSSREKALLGFAQGLEDNRELALRNLINVRNFRLGGLGERDLFREMFSKMSIKDQVAFMDIVPEIGRWDDVVYIVKNTPYKDVKHAGAFMIMNQLSRDVDSVNKGESVSLLAKWLPSDKGSRTKKENLKFIRDLGFEKKSEYRKVLSALRKQLNLVETNLTDRTYSNIELEKVPSRAFNKYKGTLHRNMPDEMEKLLTKVESGEAVIKTSGITPDEIVHEYSTYYSSQTTAETDRMKSAQWKSLLDLTNDLEQTITVSDVSGSMLGKPMDVSIGLGLYFAQQATGEFHNKFITFDSDPQFVEFSENMSLKDKVRKAVEAPWGGSTDLDKVFKLILNASLRGKLDQSEIPKNIVIITDMQFNGDEYYGPLKNADSSVFERAKRDFEKAGYQLPNVIYWNVAGGTAPVTAKENGVAVVSGFTPSTMKAIITAPSEFTPEAIMLNQLMKDEYTLLLEGIL